MRIKPAATVPTEVAVGVSDTYAAPDALAGGLPSVHHTVAVQHPVEVIQNNWQATRENLQFGLQSLAFGSHMPMRLQMERSVVAQHGRLPVLPSSHLGLEILTGKDETLEFEDYLAEPELANVPLDPHAAMEHKLQMLPGRH